MKKTALILLASVLLFSSCKKEDTTSSTDNTNTTSYSSTMTIKENSQPTVTQKGAGSKDGTYFDIFSVAAWNDTIHKTIHFTVYDATIGNHVYTENMTVIPFNMDYTNSDGNYKIIYGNLNFTTIDTVALKIKGSYNVTAAMTTDYNSQIDLSGEFDIEYLIAN